MKLLITGLSGFIGTSIVNELTKRHDVYSFSRSESSAPGINVLKGDLSEADSIYKATATVMPDAIILMGAVSSLYQIEANLLAGYLVNTKSVEHFIRSAEGLKLAKPPLIIFFSTDLVYDAYDFDCPQKFKESDPARTKTRYGRSKLEAEHLLYYYKNSLSLRIALSYSLNNNQPRGYFATLRNDVKNSKEINFFRDEWRTPLQAEDIGLLLNLILETKKPLPKTLNIGGNHRFNREEIGIKLLNHIDPYYQHIQSINRSDSPYGIIRGKDCSLDNQKVRELFEIGFNDLI